MPWSSRFTSGSPTHIFASSRARDGPASVTDVPMNGRRSPRVTWTGISSSPSPRLQYGLADAIGPRRREQHLRRVDDRAALPPARRDDADRGRLRGEVRRTREHRRVVGDAELREDVEHLVGDGVAGGAKADGPMPRRLLDGARALRDLPRDLVASEAHEIVAMVERVVGDLVARRRRLAETAPRLRAGEVAADREERERKAARVGEARRRPSATS